MEALFREKWTNFCAFLADREHLFYDKLSKGERVIYDALLDPTADSDLVENFLKKFLCDPRKITISQIPGKLFPSLSKEFWVDFNKKARDEKWDAENLYEREQDALKLERYIDFFAQALKIDLDSCRRAAAASLAQQAESEPQTETGTSEEEHS